MKSRKIIPFPHLKERLLSEGRACLEQKDFEQALSLFEQATDMFGSDVNVLLSIVVCLYETERKEEALQLCRELLENSIDRVPVLQVYISLLVQMSNFEQAISAIDEVLNNRYMTTKEYVDILQRLRNFCSQSLDNKPHRQENMDKFVQQMIQIETIEEQKKFFNEFRPSFIHTDDEKIKVLLQQEKIFPVIKTMILHELSKQKYDCMIIVKKNNKQMDVNPKYLEDLPIHDFSEEVLNYLQEQLQQDPSLFEIGEGIWLNFMYTTYPFVPQLSAKHWSAAIHFVSINYLVGHDVEVEEIANMYNVSIEGILQCLEQLNTNIEGY